MKGQTLKYLAAVADLARLDIDAASVTLRCEDGELSAGYVANYARGVRTAEADVDDFTISVSASRFKALAGMFNEEESVTLRSTPTALQMASKTMNVSLQRWGEENDFPEFDLNEDEADFIVRLSADSLISEIDAADAFTSDSQVRPELEGILLDVRKGALFVTAFDGFGALFRSELRVKTRGTGALLVPMPDFLAGARLASGAGKSIDLIKPAGEQAVILKGVGSIFRSAVIAQPFPNIDTIVEQRGESIINVESAQVRNLVSGAKVLDTGPDIEVTQRKKSVVFSVNGEAGGFETSVKGEIPTALRYDAEVLGKAVKLGLMLTFYVPSAKNRATMIESDHRKCWIMTRE